MSETVIRRTEQPPHLLIADAMYDWLSQEIENSNVNANAHLNSWNSFVKDGVAKAASHYQRVKLQTEIFRTNPSNEKVIQLQIFAAQMGISGAFRTQSYILGRDEDDYMRRRTRWHYGPLGVDIDEVTQDQLSEIFDGAQPTPIDLKRQTINYEDLADETHRVNELRIESMEQFGKDPSRKNGVLRQLKHFTAMTRLQREWLQLGVNYIVHAAQIQDGQLDKVTFLGPTTINLAQPYYPFKNNGSHSLQLAPVVGD